MVSKTPPLQGRGWGGAGPSSSEPVTSPTPDPSPEGEGLSLPRAAALLTPIPPPPRLDADPLPAHALGIPREPLLLGPERSVPPAYEALLQRRLAHEPVAYIMRS